MPVVRLVNPHLFGAAGHRRNSTRRGGKLSEKIAAIVQSEMRQANAHRERVSGVESSNPLVNPSEAGSKEGEQNFMAKKHHHKKHHRNPHVRHRRHRRNPILSMSPEELIKSLAFAAGGNIVTDMVPGALGVTGVMGYAAGAATALAASWLAGKFAGSSAGTSALIGGGLAVLRKVLNDFFPGTILASGMSGDLAFYINNGFPVPTTGSGPYLLNSGYSGSLPQMNGGMPVAVAPAVSSNGQPIATAAATAPTSGGNGPWRGEQRWAA